MLRSNRRVEGGGVNKSSLVQGGGWWRGEGGLKNHQKHPDV